MTSYQIEILTTIIYVGYGWCLVSVRADTLRLVAIISVMGGPSCCLVSERADTLRLVWYICDTKRFLFLAMISKSGDKLMKYSVQV